MADKQASFSSFFDSYASNDKMLRLLREKNLYAQTEEVLESPDANLVESYLSKRDWQVRESSNTSYSFQGLNNYISSEIIKQYWLDNLYSAKIRKAYKKGDFHIHDLGLLTSYCVGWDLQDLLLTGFGGVSGKTESKPPKHLRTALGQIVNFLYTLQGEAAGAQAFSNFDTLLAPFIRSDKLAYPEVKQALQEFVFNMNIPTRVGFQAPFTNVSLDLMVSPIFAEQSVVIGGQPQQQKYADFQAEMDIFNQALLEVLAEGDGNGNVFSFPILTYSITEDFDWDNPNLACLWEVTAKYGIPYFSNFINSDLKPEDSRSMCCRLRLDTRDLVAQGGGLFGANPLTGSIGVVTINLPRIGYITDNEEDFFKRLSYVMDLAQESLEIKRQAVEDLTEKGFYPYSKFYLRHIKERLGVYLSLIHI